MKGDQMGAPVADPSSSQTTDLKLDAVLVRQLRFSLTAVVSGGGFGLVSSSPDRPGHDKAGSDWGPEQKSGQKRADLGHCRQKRHEAHQAAAGTAGLLSFALPHVARRRPAANRARKAAAAKHKLMCRRRPCQERASQWSRPRSSLARSKHSSIVQRSPAAPASSPSETPAGAKAKEEARLSGSRRLRRIRSQCSKPGAAVEDSAIRAHSYSRSPFAPSPAACVAQASLARASAIAAGLVSSSAPQQRLHAVGPLKPGLLSQEPACFARDPRHPAVEKSSSGRPCFGPAEHRSDPLLERHQFAFPGDQRARPNRNTHRRSSPPRLAQERTIPAA